MVQLTGKISLPTKNSFFANHVLTKRTDYVLFTELKGVTSANFITLLIVLATVKNCLKYNYLKYKRNG